MKTTTLLLALVPFVSCSGLAQDAKEKPAPTEMQAGTKEKEEKKPAVTPPKPADKLLGTKVSYAGYLTELARAEKKRPFMSLRTPIDPKKDLDNLWYYPGTDKIQGVVLFSVKF